MNPGETGDGKDEGSETNPGETGDGKDEGSETNPGETGDGKDEGSETNPDETGKDDSSNDGEQENTAPEVTVPEPNPPLSEGLEYQCGMVEHTHSDACADTEDGGWYCVPDTNITINVPENRKAEGHVDLLEGVTAKPAFCGNWPVQIAVAAVTTADGESLEAEDGRWLEVEGGVVYTVDYVAYLDEAMATSEDGEHDANTPPEGILGEASGTVEGEKAEGDAKVGDKVYEKLEEAIAAVEDGETVTVLRNVDANIVSDGKSFTLDLNGHVLNSGEVGKNVVTIMNGTVTVKNGIITGGDWGDNTSQDGKGVLANNADVTLENCEIKDNRGHGKKGTTPGYMGGVGFGGGVYAYGGSLTLKDCIVSGNKSTYKGGGIFAENCAVTLTGTKVIDNTTGSGSPPGGGIHISSGSLDVDNSTISGNTASNGNGNALALTGANVKVTIKNSELSASDTKSASLIYADWGTGPIDVDLENVELVNQAGSNTSKAIYFNQTGTFTAKGCTFRDSNGSIQLLKADETSFTDCQFLNNDATYSYAGAPVYVKAGNANFTNCTFTGNKGYNAGAIYNKSTGTVTIDGCLFTGNSATNSSSAGAIYVAAGTTNVTNTVVKGNTVSSTSSSGPAGGISVNGSGTVFNMTSGAVYDNKSEKTNAHDIYVYYRANANILAANKMADGEKDFSSYAWSNLTSTVIKDELNRDGNWVATPAPEFAATIGETKYKTLDDAFKAALDQSRASGENVTVDIVEGYIPLNACCEITKDTGKYSPKVTLKLNNTNIYGVSIKNSFSVETGSTLTLSGTGTINKKIYMMGGTLNLDGNVVVSGGSLDFNNAAIYDYYDTKTDYSAIVNINGTVDAVQVALYKGTVTVGENADVGKLDALMTASSGRVQETNFVVNGSVEELNLSQNTGKSSAVLNGHIGSLTLKLGAGTTSTGLYPITKGGENLMVDALNVYPVLGILSVYDENTGRGSDGKISIYALQNPEQKVDDLVLIHGGASGLGNAVWTTSLGNKHTDGKDYKFLTAVTSDDAGNIVLRKTAVGGGNFVFVDGVNGKDTNNGTTLNTPVKTFEKAKEVLAGSSAEVISVLGAISVTGSETWTPIDGKESVTLESFPTYTGALVKVPNNASLTLQNVIIDGKKITRSSPLVENNGTLNIENGAVLTGGVNTVIYGPNNGQGIDGGAVYNKGTLNMTGGAITDNTARTGAGVFSKGTFNLSGGEISDNTGYGGRFAYSYGGTSKINSAPAGGGVFLAGSSTMNMSGGTIANNTSSVGGGISLGNETNAYTSYGGPKFTMTGGSIESNSAGQGGGIFVQRQCEATITGGSITGNEATGSFSVATGISFLYGGGGIYVNGYDNAKDNGKLHLEKVAITANTSNTSGAGIAGCPSTNVDVNVSDGGVVAGNTVNGKPYDIHVYRGIVSGPSGSDHHGGQKYRLSKYMLGGALYNWTDVETGERVPMQDVYYYDVKGSGSFYSDVGDAVIKDVVGDCNVIISGNHSVQGGGGIGTNGDVNIGKDPHLNDFFSVTVNKRWLDPDGKPLGDKELAELKGQVSTVYVDLFRRFEGSDDAWELVDSRTIEPDSSDFWYTHRPFYNLLKVLDGKKLEYKVVERLRLTGEWSEVNGGEIRIETPPIRVENENGEVDASATIDVSRTINATINLKWGDLEDIYPDKTLDEILKGVTEIIVELKDGDGQLVSSESKEWPAPEENTTGKDENADAEEPGESIEKLNTRSVGMSLTRNARAVLALYEGNNETTGETPNPSVPSTENDSSSQPSSGVAIEIEDDKQTIKISGLPNPADENPVNYTVEVSYKGIYGMEGSFSYRVQTISGNNDAVTDVFINKLNAPSLTLVKNVSGESLAGKTFNFVIQIEGMEPIEKTLTIPSDGTTDKLTLMGDGELKGVKPGTQFTVTETSGEWNPTWSVDNVTSKDGFKNGSVATGILCYGENTVTFMNYEPNEIRILY